LEASSRARARRPHHARARRAAAPLPHRGKALGRGHGVDGELPTLLGSELQAPRRVARGNEKEETGRQTMNGFTIEAEGHLEIVMKRAFDAPRELVFEALTKPELVQRWLLGPDGWSMPVCEIDLRVGGRYRYVWRNDAKDKEMASGGVFREIVPPERIV